MEILTKDMRYNDMSLTYETSTFSNVCPDMPSHAQTFLDLPCLPLGSLGDITRLNIIENEILITF